MRAHYWSCTPLADKIRGTPKPSALEWTEWDAWHSKAKTRHPVRYWIAETLLNRVQSALVWAPEKIADFFYWWQHRHDYRLEILPKYRDQEYWSSWQRVFLVSFSQLERFVEYHKALECVRWDEAARVRHGAPTRLFRWPYLRGWRSSAAGLEHLDWEIGLGSESPDQSRSAQEIKDLYIWWTQTRPQRPDPYEASGWSAIVKDAGWVPRTNRTPEEQAARDEAMLRCDQLEREYEQEDVKQLVRLVSLRWGFAE